MCYLVEFGHFMSKTKSVGITEAIALKLESSGIYALGMVAAGRALAKMSTVHQEESYLGSHIRALE